MRFVCVLGAFSVCACAGQPKTGSKNEISKKRSTKEKHSSQQLLSNAHVEPKYVGGKALTGKGTIKKVTVHMKVRGVLPQNLQVLP